MFKIETRRIADAIGADVLNIDIRQPLSSEQKQALIDAWAQFLVLRFRGQPLTDPQLIAFAENLGELDPPWAQPAGQALPARVPRTQCHFKYQAKRPSDRRLRRWRGDLAC